MGLWCARDDVVVGKVVALIWTIAHVWYGWYEGCLAREGKSRGDGSIDEIIGLKRKERREGGQTNGRWGSFLVSDEDVWLGWVICHR
jgi:hypothetical protein